LLYDQFPNFLLKTAKSEKVVSVIANLQTFIAFSL